MNFNITEWDNRDSYPGQIIQYTVEPIFGIKLKWVTEITHLEKNKYFVDEQRFGPYALWHHKHFIKEIDEGVEIIKQMLPILNKSKREKCPASELILGLECGGSDAYSGMTANPALGAAVDLLVKNGGTGTRAKNKSRKKGHAKS